MAIIDPIDREMAWNPYYIARKSADEDDDPHDIYRAHRQDILLTLMRHGLRFQLEWLYHPEQGRRVGCLVALFDRTGLRETRWYTPEGRDEITPGLHTLVNHEGYPSFLLADTVTP